MVLGHSVTMLLCIKIMERSPTEVKTSDILHHVKTNISQWFLSGKCDVLIIQGYTWYISFYIKPIALSYQFYPQYFFIISGHTPVFARHCWHGWASARVHVKTTGQCARPTHTAKFMPIYTYSFHIYICILSFHVINDELAVCPPFWFSIDIHASLIEPLRFIW